jgi:hypothetical protein
VFNVFGQQLYHPSIYEQETTSSNSQHGFHKLP